MKKILLNATLILLLISCANKEDSAKESGIPEIDSIQTTDPANHYPDELKSLLASFPEKKEFPIVLDSALIRSAEQGDSLSGKDVKYLTSEYHRHELFSFQDYTIKNFFEIDSLKISGAYPGYVETLDIGMTKDSRAHRLFYTSLNENSLLIFWEIDYHTYEACPYGSGIYLFMTHVYKGEIKESLCIALEDGGADPPVAGGTNRYAEIDASGIIRITQEDISDEDMDQPMVELTRSAYQFSIKDSSVVLEKEEKPKPEMVKRETVGY